MTSTEKVELVKPGQLSKKAEFIKFVRGQYKEGIGLERLKVMANWGDRKKKRYMELCNNGTEAVMAYRAVEINKGEL